MHVCTHAMARRGFRRQVTAVSSIFLSNSSSDWKAGWTASSLPVKRPFWPTNLLFRRANKNSVDL